MAQLLWTGLTKIAKPLLEQMWMFQGLCSKNRLQTSVSCTNEGTEMCSPCDYWCCWHFRQRAPASRVTFGSWLYLDKFVYIWTNINIIIVTFIECSPILKVNWPLPFLALKAVLDDVSLRSYNGRWLPSVSSYPFPGHKLIYKLIYCWFLLCMHVHMQNSMLSSKVGSCWSWVCANSTRVEDYLSFAQHYFKLPHASSKLRICLEG